MKNYKLEIPFVLLENMVIDHLVNSFKDNRAANRQLRKEYNKDYKEYYKECYNVNLETMKALKTVIEYFTAPDDPRRVSLKRHS